MRCNACIRRCLRLCLFFRLYAYDISVHVNVYRSFFFHRFFFLRIEFVTRAECNVGSESEGRMRLRRRRNSLTGLTRSETTRGCTRRAAESTAELQLASTTFHDFSQDQIDLQFASKEACEQMSDLWASGEARDRD